MRNYDKIMDEGVIKYINHKYIMSKRNLEREYENDYSGFRDRMDIYDKWMSDLNTNKELDKMIEQVHERESDIYKASEIAKVIEERKVKPVSTWKPSFMEHPTEMSKSDIYEYYGKTIFNPCWMLNISPNWKGGPITDDMIASFKEVMDVFCRNCFRFTKMKYVLEGGSEANFLHCHAVFELNPAKCGNLKSMKKGNFLIEFRKCWNRVCKGHEGLVKSRHALQTTYIVNEIMLKDKLDYLIEDLKPLSHRNHDGFTSIVVGDF